MNAILPVEMMDAFGIDSVFEGRHGAIVAHTPVLEGCNDGFECPDQGREAPRRARSEQLSHEEAQIEGADMDQQALIASPSISTGIVLQATVEDASN